MPQLDFGPDQHRKVLLPVDESDHSLRAVEWYFKFGKLPQDFVVLFHSVDTSSIIPSSGYTWAGPLPMTAVEKMLKEKEQEVKELKLKYVNLLNVNHVQGEFLYSSAFNHAGEAIIDACEQRSIHYVIMGNRGMGAIRRTFLGSISDYVLHHAHIPVTIIPPPTLKKDSKSKETEQPNGTAKDPKEATNEKS
ncbi:universal stress protein Sll1388-like isoform X2 [Symsagittifera roscoffensis]|uniref:universal stress protein Sll1388-like isoform X2 n=1 Tax=Symsagittifera roscoffensis TaxID=84072 RepID=UPI00307B2670